MAVGEDGSDSRAQQISALLDGELSIDQTRLLLYHMVDGRARERWDLYHLIGDAIRDPSGQTFLATDLVPRIAKYLKNEQ
jgi:negative regulator of sigma E activity